MPELNIPHFIVAGAARSGTTSLYYYLKQHPQIFLPQIKEPCYFSFASNKLNYKHGHFTFATTQLKDYKNIFNKSEAHQICGDCSTPYLYLYKQTIAQIKHDVLHADELKIIIVLRNPTQRAFSQYAWRIRDGRENLDFSSALSEEQNRINKNWSIDYHYATRGLYAAQVQAFLDNFKNTKIILYEDFIHHTKETLKDICKFLNVDDRFEFVLEQEHNKSYQPKLPWLNKLFTSEYHLKFRLLNLLSDEMRNNLKKKLFSANASHSLQIDEVSKKNLQAYFKHDTLLLEKIINRDLSTWMQ